MQTQLSQKLARTIYERLTRYRLSFSFYEQQKLHFLTNLTEGEVPSTVKILDS